MQTHEIIFLPLVMAIVLGVMFISHVTGIDENTLYLIVILNFALKTYLEVFFGD